jgi:hypothetical protein
MTLLADDGQIKSTWLLDYLGRMHTNIITTDPTPVTAAKPIPRQESIPCPLAKPTESLSAPAADPVSKSQPAVSNAEDDLFSFSDSETAYQEETWCVFISEISRRFSLE